jgi:hypothetical protein
MRFVPLFLIFMLSIAHSVETQEAKNVAVVKKLRGQVFKRNNNGEKLLIKDDWVSEGDIVFTKKASFVRLVFIDKSQINIGPKSEMLIQKFTKSDPGLLNIVKGKIRAKVTKDYLEMNKGAKSKLYLQSKSAVMGIRGTDFLFTYNPETKATSAVLFEGKVAFSKVDANENISYNDLEKIVDRDKIQIRAGEFSVASAKAKKALIPAVLNIAQKKALEKNDTFKEFDTSKVKSKKVGSLVPKGLDGKIVASSDKDLKEHVDKIVKVKDSNGQDLSIDSKKAKGYVSADGDIKAANGSFLHTETGNVIAPGSDSAYDQHSNTFIATGATGTIGADGEYIPPKGVIIDYKGQFIDIISKPDGRLPASELDIKAPTDLEVISPDDYKQTYLNGPCPPEFCPNGPLMDNFDKPDFDPVLIQRSKVKFQFNNK